MDKKEYLKHLKEVLITIDMVNGFVKEGNLASPSIMRIVPIQIKLLEEARRKKDTGLIFIRDSHPIDAEEFKVYGPHCIENTQETEIIDELKPFEKCGITYFKNSTNFMFAPNFQRDILEAENLEKIDLMGCLSEVCVKNGAISLKTFLDQFNKKVEVGVFEDAIDTYSCEGHEADKITKRALEEMSSNGIKVYKKGYR